MEAAGWLASSVGFAVAMSATPGPNNTLAAASGANFGLRRTLPQVMGVAIGFPVMLVAVAIGAEALLHDFPQFQAVLRWVGAAWLLWLAWQLATAPVDAVETSAARPMRFWEAAAFQWANPKAWTAAAGAGLAYTGGETQRALLLGLIFAAAALPCLLAWAGLGAAVGPALRRRPGAFRRFNQAMALLLALSVVPVLLAS